MVLQPVPRPPKLPSALCCSCCAPIPDLQHQRMLRREPPQPLHQPLHQPLRQHHQTSPSSVTPRALAPTLRAKGTSCSCTTWAPSREGRTMARWAATAAWLLPACPATHSPALQAQRHKTKGGTPTRQS